MINFVSSAPASIAMLSTAAAFLSVSTLKGWHLTAGVAAVATMVLLLPTVAATI